MKLSEAMRLGSCIMPLRKGDWNACALGAAANAVGIPEVIYEVGKLNNSIEIRIECLKNHWPWLDKDSQIHFITEFFDLIKMTFDEVVEYVQKIEPACGECNDTDCCCERAAGVLAALQDTVNV